MDSAGSIENFINLQIKLINKLIPTPSDDPLIQSQKKRRDLLTSMTLSVQMPRWSTLSRLAAATIRVTRPPLLPTAAAAAAAATTTATATANSISTTAEPMHWSSADQRAARPRRAPARLLACAGAWGREPGRWCPPRQGGNVLRVWNHLLLQSGREARMRAERAGFSHSRRYATTYIGTCVARCHSCTTPDRVPLDTNPVVPIS